MTAPDVPLPEGAEPPCEWEINTGTGQVCGRSAVVTLHGRDMCAEHADHIQKRFGLNRSKMGVNAPASLTPGVGKKMKCPHCGSGLLWSEDRGAHCDGCDDYDPPAPAVVTEGEGPRTAELRKFYEGLGISVEFALEVTDILESELTAANAERDKANATIERLSVLLQMWNDAYTEDDKIKAACIRLEAHDLTLAALTPKEDGRAGL